MDAHGDRDGEVSAPARRVADAIGGTGAVSVLGEVGGADLTSFLLEVARHRAARVTPTDLLRAVRQNRFVVPAAVDARVLHRTVAEVCDALPDGFELVELAPVTPLGTHSVVAAVHQDKVVTTARGTEVAADPTNGLALLAAVRRRGSTDSIRLGAAQRVLRAQPQPEGLLPHFTVLGLVTAGRDPGNLGFERSALPEHLHALCGAVGAITPAPIQIRLTNLRDRFTDAIVDEVAAALPHVVVTRDPDRATGRGYYRDLCFKLHVETEAGPLEVGDGGFTDWTQRLLGSGKERLMTSGLGLDRLAGIATGRSR